MKRVIVSSACPIAAVALVLLPQMLRAESWQPETVDQSGVGSYTSLKADKDGNLHLAYVADDSNHSLKYGFWDRNLKRWFVMKVAKEVAICDLALDSKQRPHISYADFGGASGNKLHYAYWDGAVWKTLALALNFDAVAYYNSISIGPDDNPSISFYEYRGPVGTTLRLRLRNVMRTGERWEVRTVDSDEGSGKFNAQAADSRGHIHIGYANVSAGTASMRYAYWDGKSWKTELLEGLQTGAPPVGYSAYLALDGSGNPHVTYSDVTTGNIKYAVRKDGRWRIELVDRVAGVSYPDRNSLAFDENGQPYIGYYDGARGDLRVAYRQGQQWVSEIVDSGVSGFTSSMQIDRGILFISYASEAAAGIKVAQRKVRTVSRPATSQNVAPDSDKGNEAR